MKRAVLSLAAVLSGPLIVLATLPLYGWSLYGGLGTMCVVSFVALRAVWKLEPTKNP